MMGTPPPLTCFLVLAAVVCVLATSTRLNASSSCLQVKDVTPQHVIIKDKHSPLILGVSERLTHRLTSEVFKIFLSDVLGYPDVRIMNVTLENGSFDTLEKFHYDQSLNQGFMIDVEMWIPLGENLADLEYYEFKESGELGRPVRYGWFIPSDMLRTGLFKGAEYGQQVGTPVVTFDTFLKAELASNFALLDEDISSLVLSDKYEPTWCQNKHTCATLLSSSKSATHFVRGDIITMRLFVRVLWIKDELFLETVNHLLELYRSSVQRSSKIVMILGHSLELLAFPGDFSAVGFPVCNHYANRTLGCNYEGQKLMKVQWNELQEAATSAAMALAKLEFTPDDYKQLIMEYMNATQGPSRVHDAACAWMTSHIDKVKRWKPEVDSELLLVGIFPVTRPVFAADGIFKGAQMAINEINNGNFLGNYKLRLLLEDGGCKADVVMRTFIALVTHHFNKIVGILGPACSETVEPLAGVATHFETVVISYSAEGSTFSDRSKYPYFFRTIGENTQYQFVYQELFRKLGWKRVASLSEDGTKYPEYVTQTQDLLKKDGVTFVANRKFSPAKEVDWKQYLQEFKSLEARIIIADVNEAAAKALMCEAYHMNMTAKYGFVWFLPAWLMPFWLEKNISHNITIEGRNVHCTYEQMLEAIDAHLSLSHAFFAADNETILTNKTVKEWRKEYEEIVRANNTGNKKGNSSDYAGYAYDAVWVYAKALDALIKENQTDISNLHSHDVTQKFVRHIQNMNFSGVSGTIEFKGGSSRNNTRVNIYQWNSKTLQRVEVGLFDPKAPTKKRFILYEKSIRWLTEGGKVPWDGTLEVTCVIDWLPKMLGTDCQTAIVIANVLGFGLLFLLGLVGFLFIKHRYDKKVQLTQKYMKSLGIDLLSPTAMSSLDKWEIPKEKVVINRKLGEGAFGMVYGGEASFPEKGWVAVAVKTLKVGSSAEEKLDFLSEAEVMKRFEHKNIVQLLGVCTKSEPVYTIMEFMLYGDLKTYLLARRHLVNDGIHDENDEISSKKLTNMALDIARALSYLAELKYVHRDVASRNCLVNASRVVKLADFGMTRPMCDHDYYKFNRKGMLPVRWMAPESLALGVFTPASDVWSYGVLLYEIITFGNFPFQGMTNNQVLEYVKEGNTLTIPKGVKTNLETLIRSCWNIEYQKRPAAAEIVEFLANSPRIISPCLDVPLSSVPPMEDNTLGMPLSEGKTRKFSMTLRQRTSASPSNEVRPWTEFSEPLLPSSSGRNWPMSSNSLSEDTVQDIVFPL